MYNIYYNDRLVGQCIASKRGMQKWLDTQIIGTHMAQWVKYYDGYEYATTIGRYYRFRKAI